MKATTVIQATLAVSALVFSVGEAAPVGDISVVQDKRRLPAGQLKTPFAKNNKGRQKTEQASKCVNSYCENNDIPAQSGEILGGGAHTSGNRPDGMKGDSQKHYQASLFDQPNQGGSKIPTSFTGDDGKTKESDIHHVPARRALWIEDAMPRSLDYADDGDLLA